MWTLKAENTKSKIESIDASLNPELLRLTQQARDKGASSWLNAIPLKDQGLTLNNQQFRDSLRLRYNLPLQDLPSTCACGEPFNVSHARSCKKGGGVCGSTPRRSEKFTDLSTQQSVQERPSVASPPAIGQ